jgi:hypothetical protein
MINVMMVVNMAFAFIFLIVYSVFIEKTKLMNFPLITSKRDFRNSDATYVNESITLAGCGVNTPMGFYLPKKQMLDQTSAACHCIARRLPAILWYNESVPKGLASASQSDLFTSFFPSNGSQTDPFNSFNSFNSFNLLNQKTDTAMSNVLIPNHLQIATILTRLSHSDPPMLNNPNTTHVFQQCMWTQTLTIAEKYNTAMNSNTAVMASMLNWSTVVFSVMWLCAGVSEDNLRAVLTGGSFIAVVWLWHITLISITLQSASSSIVIVTFMSCLLLGVHCLAQYLIYKQTGFKNSTTLKRLWLFLLHYMVTLPILMLMYNASHFHLDIVYNVVTVMMTLVISLGSSTAIVAAYNHTTEKPVFDQGMFSFCNVAIIVVLYLIVPQEYPHFSESSLMTMSVTTLLVFLLPSILCSFDKLWTPTKGSMSDLTKSTLGLVKKEESSSKPLLSPPLPAPLQKCIGLDALTVLDFGFRTGVMIAVMMDMNKANREL